MTRVAVATSVALPHLDEDGPALLAALAAAGVEAVPAVWDDPRVDWAAYDLVVIRSTWDYVERRDAYVRWAHAVSITTPVANPAAILDWNTDKRYLAALAAAGLPVVPTTWLEPGDAFVPPAGEYVVKPSVSAGAAETARYGPDEAVEAAAHVARLHGHGARVMVQPYLDRVDESGETALVYFRGELSHAMRKGQILFPGQGVQPMILDDDPRELMAPREPSATERAVAERVLDAVPVAREDLLYARVDLVPGPDGEPVLLELELTEPSLFLGGSEGAADRFAAAIRAYAAA